MGWMLLALLAVGSLGASWLLGAPRVLLTLVAAALTLGAVGYAVQGKPRLAGVRAVPDTGTIDVDPDIIALRSAMIGRFTFAHDYFVVSDALLRAGSPASAATYMLSGINKARGNYAVWMGLGETLAERDGRALSPAATFAFRRAMTLAPSQPAPPFFYGLALVRAGDFAAARIWWARAVALAPREAPYRDDLVVRLRELDQLLALVGG